MRWSSVRPLLLAVILVLLGFVVSTLLGNALRNDLRQRLEDRAGYAVVLQQQGVAGQTLADQMSGNGVFPLVHLERRTVRRT